MAEIEERSNTRVIVVPDPIRSDNRFEVIRLKKDDSKAREELSYDIQGEVNKDLIMLELPVGHMTMEDGDVVTVRSNSGAYRQDTERFFLEGDVFLEHVQGYTLESSEAHIDLKQNFAWSEKDVYATGPDMAIDAKGIKANGQTGEIIFQGPARLVLEKGFEGVQ